MDFNGDVQRVAVLSFTSEELDIPFINTFLPGPFRKFIFSIRSNMPLLGS